MINLRYHIMSLVAVLLALVLGVAAGSAVVDQGLVDQLEQNLDRLDRNLSEAGKNNERLSNQLRELREVQRQFDQEASARYLSGTMSGAPVLVLGTRGVDEAAVRDLNNALEIAGADLQGVVWIEPKAALEQPEDVARLGAVMATTVTDVGGLHEMLARRLGVALTGASAASSSTSSTTSTTSTIPAVPTPASRDAAEPTSSLAPSSGTTAAGGGLVTLLDSLQDEGFVAVERADGVSVLELTDAVVIVVDSPALLDPVRQPVLAVVRDLAQHPSVPTLVVDIPVEQPRGTSAVEVVRSDSTLRERLSTVDDARSLHGWTAVASAAAQLRAGDVGHHYGHGKGAESLLPPTTS